MIRSCVSGYISTQVGAYRSNLQTQFPRRNRSLKSALPCSPAISLSRFCIFSIFYGPFFGTTSLSFMSKLPVPSFATCVGESIIYPHLTRFFPSIGAVVDSSKTLFVVCRIAPCNRHKME